MMKRIQSRVKTTVLPRAIEIDRFIFMAFTFLLFTFLLWSVTVIGQHTR
jgi:hypothetical protein